MKVQSKTKVIISGKNKKFFVLDKKLKMKWANEKFNSPEEAKEFCKENNLKVCNENEI